MVVVNKNKTTTTKTTRNKRSPTPTTTTTSNKKMRRATPAPAVPTTSIADLPDSVLAGSVFPYLDLKYNLTKNILTKVLRGKQGAARLQQQYVKTTLKEPEGGCLEEIHRRYPFLPRNGPQPQQPYIFVRPEGIYDVFETDCKPWYPIHAGRCCFRIDYTREKIQEILPEVPMTTRENVKHFIQIVDGVSKTFDNFNTPLVDLYYFYQRARQLLSLSPQITLTFREMSALLHCLRQKTVFDFFVNTNKVDLVVEMIRHIHPMTQRMDYIRQHWKEVMSAFRCKDKTVQKDTQDKLYQSLMMFDPVFPLTPEEKTESKTWNEFIFSRMEKLNPTARKKLFETFANSVYSHREQWRHAAAFYVEDLLPILITQFPDKFESRSVEKLLNFLPPYPETVPLWVNMYHRFAQGLTKDQKQHILAYYFKNIEKEQHDADGNLRNRGMGLYTALKNQGIDIDVLQPTLFKFFRRHKFLPGTTKRIETTLTQSGVL